MHVKAPVEVRLGAGSFGGVQFATIVVTLPPSPFTQAEVQTFAPDLLQVRDYDERRHRDLAVDDRFVTTSLRPDMLGYDECMEALDEYGILVLNLITYLEDEDEDGQERLLVRSLIAENVYGRVLSDTGPVVTTAAELDGVMATMPEDVEERLEGRELDGVTELADLLDMSGKHRTVDPSTLN